MRMDLKVTYIDGRVVDAVARPKDIVAFERQYGKSVAVFADTKNPASYEWLCYLAWSPLHRLRQETRAFDEFLDDVDDVEVAEEAPAMGPTQPEVSADSSPGSPSEAA